MLSTKKVIYKGLGADIMKSENEILKLIEVKQKLCKYFQQSITPEMDSEKQVTVEKLIEIQLHEIELLEWVLE